MPSRFEGQWMGGEHTYPTYFIHLSLTAHKRIPPTGRAGAQGKWQICLNFLLLFCGLIRFEMCSSEVKLIKIQLQKVTYSAIA